jgi:hypothetical protein
MDYEIQRCARRCAATDTELSAGEEFYSVLVQNGAELVRQDYCVEAWSGPPEGSIAYWKSQMPNPRAKRIGWAPNDVMLEFFEQLENEQEKADMRFVLALLLVRRRVLRQEDSLEDEQGQEVMVVYCPRRDTTYKVPVIAPDDEGRTRQIQDELAKLLFANAS